MVIVHLPYSDPMLSTTTNNRRKGWSKRDLMELKHCVEQFMRSLVREF